jgi:hypothetical protein
VLLDHADRVLMLARLAFEGSAIAVKVSCRSLAHKIHVPVSSFYSSFGISVLVVLS